MGLDFHTTSSSLLVPVNEISTPAGTVANASRVVEATQFLEQTPVNRSLALSASASPSLPNQAPLSTVFSNQTSEDRNFTSSCTSFLGNLSSTIPWKNITGNGTIGADECWTQWLAYWTASSENSENEAMAVKTSPYKTTVNYTVTVPEQLPTSLTTSWTWTETEVEAVDGFTFWSSTLSRSYTEIKIFDEGMPGITATDVETNIDYSTVYPNTNFSSGTLTAPSCVLNSVVPQCQSQWELWESDSLANIWTIISPPMCTQASMDAVLCESIRNSWLVGQGDPVTAFATRGNQLTLTTWPRSTSLAPGCTLGCGTCAITGGTARLIYWPVTTTAVSNISSSLNLGISSPLTAYAFNTSFVSPTIYISYMNIHASDSCSGIGSVHDSTIVAVPIDMQLSSLWRTSFGQMMTAAFNYTDLLTPIPISLWDRQPRCADWGEANWFDANGLNTTYLCPFTATFEPILVIPQMLLQSLDPAWASCGLDLRGQYDPPYPLTPYARAAAPTPSEFMPSSPAAPGSPIMPPSITRTADPVISDPWKLPKDPTNRLVGTAQATSNKVDPGRVIASIVEGTAPLPNTPVSKSQILDPELSSADGNSATGAGAQLASLLADPPTNSISPPKLSPQHPPTHTSIDPDNAAGAAIVSIIDGQAVQSADSGHPSPPQPDDQGNNSPGSVAGSGNEEAAGHGDSDPSAKQETHPTIPQPEVGGHSIVADPLKPGGVIIGTKSLALGVTANIAGTSVFNGPNGIVMVVPSTIHLPRPGSDASNVALASIDSQAVSLDGSGAVIVGGTQRIKLGESTIINNTPVSLGPAGLVMAATSTIPIAENRPTPHGKGSYLTRIGSHETASDPANPGDIIIDGTKALTPGASTDIDNTLISVNSAGLVVGTSTIAIPSAKVDDPAPAVVTIGNQAVTARPGSPLVVDHITLFPGGAASTVFGESISLASDGVVIDGSAHSFSSVPASTTNPVEVEAIFTIADHSYMAYEVAGKSRLAVFIGVDGLPTTLSISGSAATVVGQVVSLNAAGVTIGTGTRGSEISFRTATASIEAIATFIGTDGQVLTAIEPSPNDRGGSDQDMAIIDGNVTLTVGGPSVIIDGETLSLADGGLVLHGRTESWSAITAVSNGQTVEGSGLGAWSSTTPLAKPGVTRAADPGLVGGDGGAQSNAQSMIGSEKGLIWYWSGVILWIVAGA
ncbi:MAG: hypothetical protein M1822_004011 [Bathelium mastoideum]|nr:MAG: hypothetical protein M1822_004011 [Bathelium mastoideum]